MDENDGDGAKIDFIDKQNRQSMFGKGKISKL